MKLLLNIVVMIFSFFNNNTDKDKILPESIYDFKVESLSGDVIDFSHYKGKKILIVNTASKCGLTPQYEELEKLYQKYQQQLVIVGFPSNNFMWQEPGTNSEIGEFCKKNYGVTFPMGAKIDVKGKDKAPIYQWLTSKKYNNVDNYSIKWNFQKFLLDEHGKLIAVFDPTTKPLDPSVISAIEKK